MICSGVYLLGFAISSSPVHQFKGKLAQGVSTTRGQGQKCSVDKVAANPTASQHDLNQPIALFQTVLSSQWLTPIMGAMISSYTVLIVVAAGLLKRNHSALKLGLQVYQVLVLLNYPYYIII